MRRASPVRPPEISRRKTGKRVVQAWRVQEWPEGVYSIARFELSGEGAGTRLSFEHAGFPAAMRPHLEGGWAKMYWEPLAKYLG